MATAVTETKSEQDEKYADKIAKLLAKAESTNFPEEADAFLAAAQSMMVKYAISEALIDQARGVERDEIVQDTLVYKGTYRQATSQIGWAITRANECRGVYWDDSYSRFYNLTVTGFQSDVSRVKLLDASLQIQCAKALNEWWRNFDGASWMDRNQKFAARREFIFGFARGLTAKLRLAAEEGQKDAAREEAERTGKTDAEASESVALVLRGRKDRVDDWMDKKYGKLRSSSKTYKSGGYSAASAGQQAGLRADTGTASLRGQGQIGS